MVSIVCATYNHERYIGDALQGFLAQSTTFPFEIIVHDDASTDSTGEILRAYKTQYPDIVKPIMQLENQYSKGCFKPTCYAAKSAAGQYIAICEGDDYWIDENKLQRQITSLQENADVDFSFHSAYVLSAEGAIMERSWEYGNDGTLHLDTLLNSRLGSFAPTASYVFRKRVFEELPPWFASEAPVADFFLERYGALRGGALYFERPMSVYRSMISGSWTAGIRDNQTAHQQYLAGMCRSFELMAPDFERFAPHFSKFCARFLLKYAIEALFRGDNPQFYQLILQSVEQCRYVSKKQQVCYRLRGLPFLVRNLIRARRLATE